MGFLHKMHIVKVFSSSNIATPAQAGVQSHIWIPARAGMTPDDGHGPP